MVNDLATTDGAEKALAAARLQATADSLYRSIERNRTGVDTLPALPSPALRKELTERKRTLHAVLRPISMATAEQTRAREAIGALLGAYEVTLRVNNLRATAAGYLAHLAEQPLFAIIAAVDDFKHGRVYDIDGDGKRVAFPIDRVPNAFRLLDQVKKHAGEVQAEHYKIGRVLAITKAADEPLVSPEEAARVAESLGKLVGGMMKRVTKENEADRQRNRAEAQAARDRAQRIIQDAARKRERDSQEQALG